MLIYSMQHDNAGGFDQARVVAHNVQSGRDEVTGWSILRLTDGWMLRKGNEFNPDRFIDADQAFSYFLLTKKPLLEAVA